MTKSFSFVAVCLLFSCVLANTPPPNPEFFLEKRAADGNLTWLALKPDLEIGAPCKSDDCIAYDADAHAYTVGLHWSSDADPATGEHLVAHCAWSIPQQELSKAAYKISAEKADTGFIIFTVQPKDNLGPALRSPPCRLEKAVICKAEDLAKHISVFQKTDLTEKLTGQPPDNPIPTNPPATTSPSKPIDEERVVLTPFEIPDSYHNPANPDFFKDNLGRCGLVPLHAMPPGTFVIRIRFLWIRSFHPAALFEVEHHADGTGSYRASYLNKEGKWTPEKSTTLPKDSMKSTVNFIAKYQLMTLPRYDNSGGLDGSRWFVEVMQDGKYNEIYRWSPTDGPVRAFGQRMIEAGINSVFMPIY